MKNYLKIFLFLVAVFVVLIGINVSALKEEIIQEQSEINVVLPIHKTDENGKGLEGAIFTLKDFNNSISYSSSDEKDGDYLIKKYVWNEDSLDRIINALPSNYKEVIMSIDSWEDVLALQDRDDMYVNADENYADVGFIVPLRVEETVVPTGYQKQDYVVTGRVSIYFNKISGEPYRREDIEARSEYYDDFYEKNISISAYLNVVEVPYNFPGYFEYDSSKDYATLYKDLNKKLFAGDSEIYSKKIFEDAGYNTKNVDCPDVVLGEEAMLNRETFEDIQLKLKDGVSLGKIYSCSGGPKLKMDLEARFDDEIEDCYCVINIKNKKQNIIVNPETAGTIGIVTLLLVISLSIIFYTRKINNN